MGAFWEGVGSKTVPRHSDVLGPAQRRLFTVHASQQPLSMRRVSCGPMTMSARSGLERTNIGGKRIEMEALSIGREELEGARFRARNDNVFWIRWTDEELTSSRDGTLRNWELRRMKKRPRMMMTVKKGRRGTW